MLALRWARWWHRGCDREAQAQAREIARLAVAYSRLQIRVADLTGRLEAAERRVWQQRGQIEDQAAQAANALALADEVRHLKTSLSGTREQLRQAQAEQARAEQALAERRIILPGQRADLGDPGEEKRYYDGLGDQ